MEDPAKEIQTVTVLVTAAVNPEIQKASVLKYYAPDVTFRHPLCMVPGGPQSRDQLLDILQWYRMMSPKLTVRVTEFVYDKGKNTIFLDVTQTFHMRWSPLNPVPARLVVHLKLRPVPSPSKPSKTVYVIANHEDFYHPEDLAALTIPPLIPLIRAALRVSTFACKLNAKLFAMFGFWAVNDGEGGRGVSLQPQGEPLPVAGENEQAELQEGST